MFTTRNRRGLGVAATVAVIAAGGVASIAGSASAAGKGKGRPDSGTSWIGKVPKPGVLQYEAGFSSDKILGAGAVTYAVKASPGAPGTVTITVDPVRLYTSRGSLTGVARATLVTAAGGAVTLTGTLSLTKGTGGLTSHSLVGTITGSGNAVTGQYVISYTGVYR